MLAFRRLAETIFPERPRTLTGSEERCPTYRTSRSALMQAHRCGCVPQSCGIRGETLNQEQRRIFEQVAELFEIDRAERAVDHPMVAAHPDRHAMTDDDLIAIIDDRHFR